MSEQTGIQWTDSTWNIVTGCTRVGPGCARCYIERTPPFRMVGRRFAMVGNESTTGVTLHWDRLLKVPRGPKVFTPSLGDLFHDEVPDVFIASAFDVMRKRPDRIFQVLTKRPERALDWFTRYAPAFERFRDGVWPLPNVWMGVSIENARYTWRADVLREIPAAVRFISAEPLLGSLFSGSVPAQDQGRTRSRLQVPLQDAPGSHLYDGRPNDDVSELRPGPLSARSAGPVPGHRREVVSNGCRDHPGDQVGDDSVRLPVLQGGRRGDGHPDARSGGHGEGSLFPSDGASSDSLSAEVGLPQSTAELKRRAPLNLSGIDWVIIGGESGPGSRPFHLEHAREIIQHARDRCPEWGCPPSDCDDPTHNRPAVFVKQLGAKPIGKSYIPTTHGPSTFTLTYGDVPLKLLDRKGGDPDEWPADLRIREFPRTAVLA